MDNSRTNISGLLRQLNEIGIALSAEKDRDRLLELILVKAMRITHADGGTLYIMTDDGRLGFEIMRTRSLNIHKGGGSGEAIPFYPIALYNSEGKPNNHMVAARAAISGQTVNVADAYASGEFDFSGTRNFDNKTGYRSVSFLTTPMINHESDIIGVLQLINATDAGTGRVIPFSAQDQQVVESLASQAAVTITTKNLINDQKNLFNALIQLIANAIDEKSPYTAGHCRRVPVITNLLAAAASRIDKGPLKDFAMTDEEKYELDVAAWLHDCGKITTPEFIMDKSTKLETIFDRVRLVDLRFEILKRDSMLLALRSRLSARDDSLDIDRLLREDAALQAELTRLDQERKEIRQYNIGGESLSAADLKRIEEIAARTWQDPDNRPAPLLNDEEARNLRIERGTLTREERQIINNHVSVSIKMLKSLPYPKYLARVPEYAGGHHEKMDGSGYPNKLTREQMSIPARMMAIADVFEALTAPDRPYKKAMSLSQSLKILGQMKVDNHIDADLFDVFMHEQVYLAYANEYLPKEQIDEFDFADIPGYQPL